MCWCRVCVCWRGLLCCLVVFVLVYGIVFCVCVVGDVIVCVWLYFVECLVFVVGWCCLGCFVCVDVLLGCGYLLLVGVVVC